MISPTHYLYVCEVCAMQVPSGSMTVLAIGPGIFVSHALSFTHAELVGRSVAFDRLSVDWSVGRSVGLSV